ncbi:MAG: acyltransferase [Actinomycetia bacterium]|nr:acyltransferase [Actinomycetes bacterium]
MSADDVARATPANRDRYVDFVRAFSIVVVVAGHWTIALIFWEDGQIFVHNVVGHQSGLWLATWALQVMPLFFFVGGFSNARGWNSLHSSGGSYREFMQRRLTRLFRPTAVFVGVWVIVETGLHVLEVGAAGVFRGTFLPFGPLWFLAVYVAVVAFTPVTLALHERWHSTVVSVLVGLIVVVEVARFGFGIGWIGWLNLLTVWVLVHQIGFFYADGSLVRAGPRLWWGMVTAGLGGLVVLTNLDIVTGELWFPRSMVGVDIEPISNMSPPSLAIAALACWLIGAAMLLRVPVSGWLHRHVVWAFVVRVNTVIMTLFLWHLTAFVIAIVVLYPLGFGKPVEPTLRWWAERFVWIAAPALILSILVLAFGRFEQPTPTKSRP